MSYTSTMQRTAQHCLQLRQPRCPPAWMLDCSESDYGSSRKENDGSSPYQRQRRLCRILGWILVAALAYQILVTHILMGMVPDIEIDKETGQKRIRRRPERIHKVGPDGKLVKRTPRDGVIEGHLHLIDIHIAVPAITSTRYNVQATFCALEWQAQQKDPTAVPLFDDLVRSSDLCAATRYTTDLYDAAQEAREWDLQLRNVTLKHDIWKRLQSPHIPQPEAKALERSLLPTALIFHESRCGSTLVANLLAAFHPESTKVYSEADAPLKALQLAACPDGGGDATSSSSTSSRQQHQGCPLHQQLIRDVFYFMGRTQRYQPEHHVFFKLQSQAVQYVELLEQSLAQPVPWMYLYRDNIPVLVSHFLGSVVDPKSEETNVLGVKKGPKCLERYGQQRDQQPKALEELVQGMGRTVASLSKEEYCAAHLASLSESAIQHFQAAQSLSKRHQETPHFFVNYNQLPDVLWDHVLPTLDIHLKAKDIARLEKVAAIYTQGRKQKTTKKAIFTGDSHHKQQNVPPSIEQAANTFMGETYSKLEWLKDLTLREPAKKKDEDN